MPTTRVSGGGGGGGGVLRVRGVIIILSFSLSLIRCNFIHITLKFSECRLG